MPPFTNLLHAAFRHGGDDAGARPAQPDDGRPSGPAGQASSAVARPGPDPAIPAQTGGATTKCGDGLFSDVRLVIWDLDETFWAGTLTEGGLTYNRAHHDIVVELCRRGIMSSICSKNDHAAVETVLTETGLWDHFIFPSIDWSPKAERVARIIEAVQLRPETVLFVDDNPGNRAQVAAAVPGIQVADETAIASFLSDPGFRGKSDAGMSRLKQYKLLEARHAEKIRAGGDPRAFLRGSNITVEIVYDVETHIDRAVELVNRTNQLNFTKLRLPEDKEAARGELLEQIAPFHVRAGLVRVRDRYGDYGLCGFFLVRGLAAWGRPHLQHFAFSCRTLGMGVEQYVYDILGRPQVQVVGEVLSDLAEPVDWINLPQGGDADGADGARLFRDVRIRGGCELEVIGHFFRAHAESVDLEVLEARGALYVPRQNSLLLAQAASGITPAQQAAAAKLGMDARFFDAAMFGPCGDGTLLLYSPTGDSGLAIHRHRETGLEVPLWIREILRPEHPHRSEADAAEYDRIGAVLREEFDTLLPDDMARYAASCEAILRRVPGNALLIVVLPNELGNQNGTAVEITFQRQLNDVFRSVGARHPNLRFIEMTAMIRAADEIDRHYLHFSRAVYFRLFEEVARVYRAWLAGRPARRPGGDAGTAPAEWATA
ncbi:HAD-IIIC family phosphatase [Roseomonas sp. CCTCC AB2023176]|uniref:HAD-IIIC family phosphatase n=1 Tax=Roseomonas sp. CCTCC AB2023176 TaxID=3342640 RepID=UPI0035DDDECB